MGNEMGNNNASGFREEEKLIAEAPEKSLLEGGADYDEVADGVNGDHQVTEMIAHDKEEGKNEACNPAESQIVSGNSTDRNEEDSEVHMKSKEDETMELHLKENILETEEQKHKKQASNGKETEGEKGSDPKHETISNLEYLQQEMVETEAESLVEDNIYPEECKNEVDLSLKHTDHRGNGDLVDSENATNMNGGIDTNQDMEKEEDGKNGRNSNLNTTVFASDDLKHEKIFNLKYIQNDMSKPEDESLDTSLNHKDEENGPVIITEKSTNVDQGIGAGTEADEEKEKDELIEPKSYHECIKAATENINIEDGETETDLIIHNSSGSQTEEAVVIESSKSAVQVPEVEEKFTVLTEESQLKENSAGIGMIVHEDISNIPAQLCEISNEFQAEFTTAMSDSENDTEEAMVFHDSDAKNSSQNEAPGQGSQGSDGENGEISEQGITNLTSSVRDCKNENTGKMTDNLTNNGHEAEKRDSEETHSQLVIGFQSQVHLQENSNRFQSVGSADESISLRQETERVIDESKKNSSDYHSATSTETKLSTDLIDEKSAETLPFSTFGDEHQESSGRTSNESNSDNSICHIEMRKSPSFNIDIKSEGRAEDSDKIPLLYQIKTIEDLPNRQEISFPNPMEKRVIKLGKSVSHKSNSSFLGFAKEKQEAEMEITAPDQDKAADKKAEENSPPASATRKGKRRSKSLMFGTCICCATAIN